MAGSPIFSVNFYGNFFFDRKQCKIFQSAIFLLAKAELFPRASRMRAEVQLSSGIVLLTFHRCHQHLDHAKEKESIKGKQHNSKHKQLLAKQTLSSRQEEEIFTDKCWKIFKKGSRACSRMYRPQIFFSRIVSSEALLYNSIFFFRTGVFRHKILTQTIGLIGTVHHQFHFS